jgi:hypothetical protein
MSAVDPIAVLLRGLDQPVAPRPEFAESLLERLLEELEPLGVARGPLRPRRTRFRSRRTLALAFAIAAVGAAVAAVVVLTRPQKASALDVIREARHAFAGAPRFQATVRLDLNPDGSNADRSVPRGASETVVVSYGGPTRFRAEVISQQPHLRSGRLPGSYEVFDGRRIGSFDPRSKVFESAPAPSGFRPLEFLSWHGAYPDWGQVCRGPNSKVLRPARILGRDARHIRCGNFRGDVWQLWIDHQTGLLLKIVGRVGGDDVFFGLGASTSAKGGFEITHLQFNPTFPSGTFSAAAPPGAFDYAGRVQAALAKVPPFRAVVAARYGRATPTTYVDEVWWLNERAWRREVLFESRRDPRGFRGVGSFSIWANGRMGAYNAADKTFSRGSGPDSALDPAVQLLAVEDSTYSTARCPIVGHERIAGRQTEHRRCKQGEVWVDRATGLALRRRFRDFELRVRSIVYRPHLPPGTFRFVPPAGSRSAEKLASDPYYRTRLAPGKPAPSWHAVRLAGGRFQLEDLRGRPVLLVLLPDSCGDPACDVFGPLEHAYQHSKGGTRVVWVDLWGTARGAERIVRLNHLTFSVVVDHGGSSLKAWSMQGFPYWLLLDSHGRVVEARFKPQTVTQINHMLKGARPAPR